MKQLITLIFLTAYFTLCWNETLAQPILPTNDAVKDNGDWGAPERGDCFDNLDVYECEEVRFTVPIQQISLPIFVQRIQIVLTPENLLKRVYEQPKECCDWGVSRCCEYDQTCCNYRDGRGHYAYPIGMFGGQTYAYFSEKNIQVLSERCREYDPNHFNNHMSVLYELSGETGSIGMTWGFSARGIKSFVPPNLRLNGRYKKCVQ